MSRLPRTLISAVILILGTAGVSVTSQGQTDASASRSCDANNLSGRPTLKRRELSATSPKVKEVGANEPAAQREICLSDKNEVREGNNQKPVLINFQGLHSLSQTVALSLLREEGAEIGADRMPDSREADKALGALKRILQTHGFVQATVEILKDETSRSVTFLVSEGARFPITEIRFEGNQIFSSSELATKLREYRSANEESDDSFDAEKFEFSLRRLTNFARARGYLQAKFGKPKYEPTGQGLVLIIPVEEGLLYRLGEVEIEGASVFPPQQIRAMLSLQPGSIAGGETIGKWLFEDLKKAYGERGYIEFTADIEPEFKRAATSENEGVVDFSVTIEERQQFKVSSIVFQGSNLPQKELRDMLLVRDGDVFNQKLFEDTVKRINKTGWFEIIDKDKDADFRTNEEEALVSIVIKVAERQARVRGSEP